jgi:Trypsin
LFRFEYRLTIQDLCQKCNVLENDNVLVGAYAFMKEQDGAVTRHIIKRQMHPEFDPASFTHNFMVLKLDRKVDTIPPVKLLESDKRIPEGEELIVIGLGSTAARIQISKIDSEVFQHTVVNASEELRYGNDDGPVTRMNDAVLQREDITIVPHEVCNAEDQFAGFIDNNTMICAGNLNDGVDICTFVWFVCLFVSDTRYPVLSQSFLCHIGFGDSGGPLCLMENGKCIQIGIVSFGTTCAIRDRAGVYSRVSSAYDWIKDEICNLSSNPPEDCSTPSPTQQPIISSSPFVGRPDDSYLQPSIVSLDDIAGRQGSIFPSDSPSPSPSGQPSPDPTNDGTRTPNIKSGGNDVTASPSFVSSNTSTPSLEPSVSVTNIPSYKPSIFPSTEPSSFRNTMSEIPTIEIETLSPNAMPTFVLTHRPTKDQSYRASPPPHRINVRTEDTTFRDPSPFIETSESPHFTTNRVQAKAVLLA